MIALALLLCAANADPRVVEAQQLAAHGEESAALAQLQAVLDDVEDSGDDGSAALHRNIGTLALRTGDLGLAMRHLLSAQRRNPGDDDVAHNLRLVRDARADRVEGASSSSSLGQLGQQLSPAPVRVAAGLSLLLLGLVVLARGLLGRRLPIAVIGVFALGAVTATSLWVARLRFERQTMFVIVRDTRASESPDARAVDAKGGFDVHPGLTGLSLSRQGDWEHLRLENGVEAWIKSADVATVR
ncbi:MAG: hypothetical protein Q8O67_11755 [Deltaproteobacteria bacterium]|nr:hypothetical protein [Deltaproteobacteria bacterium]